VVNNNNLNKGDINMKNNSSTNISVGTSTSAGTKIEWTDETWNPVVGCHQISSGCKNCYAKSMHRRHVGNHKQPKYIKPFEEVMTWESELETPYRWNAVKRVFVCSMSDLFNKEVPTEFIKKVFDVMNSTPHYYQVLTKRTERLKELAPELIWTPNIWAGVTVENGDHLDRIDHLRDVPSSIRFISFEPLIGDLGDVNLQGIHWAIGGGESGTSFKSLRPVEGEWVVSLKDQCIAQGVAFFFKQWGRKEFNPVPDDPSTPRVTKDMSDAEKKFEKSKPKGGNQIDGAVYNEFPQFPIYKLNENKDHVLATV
jgi:protein gp37